MYRRRYCAVVTSTLLGGCSAVSNPLASSEEERTLNGSYTTGSGIKLSVDRLEIVTSSSGVVVGQDTPLASRRDGFALPHLAAENTSDTPSDVPVAKQFAVALNGDSYDPYQEDFKDAPGGPKSSISEPVSGSLFPAEDRLSPGGQTDGWLVFGIPLSTEEIAVQLVGSDGNPKTQWTLSLNS